MTLRRLFWASTRQSNGLDALEDTGGKQAAVFVTLQALMSFPVAAGVITVIWNVLQTAGDWGDSKLVALALSALVGLFLTIWSITDPTAKLTTRDKVGAVVIGIINVFFLYASVVGIDTQVADLTTNNAN